MILPFGVSSSMVKRAADFEQALLGLHCVLPYPPSREVFLEEYRRANLTTSVEVTPAEVAKRLVRDWATQP